MTNDVHQGRTLAQLIEDDGASGLASHATTILYVTLNSKSMKTIRIRGVGVVLIGMLLSSAAVGACDDQPTSTKSRGIPERVTGNVKAEVFGRNDEGRLISMQASGRIDTDLSGKNSVTVPHFSVAENAKVTGIDSASWNERPTFGAPIKFIEQNGKRAASFEVHAERLGKPSTVDGKLAEAFFVREGGAKTGKPVGAILQINGRTTQYVEFEFRGSDSKKPTAATAVVVDSNLRVIAQMRIDLRDIEYANRVADRDILGEQKAFGRLMRGLEGLVLPDQLHAQVAYGHPCFGDMNKRDVAVIVTLGALATATYQATLCTVAFVLCPTAVAAAIAAAVAAATSLYFEWVFLECLDRNPVNCGMFEDNPCGTAGSGGGGGGGGTGGGGEGGSGTGGGSGGGGGFSCQYHEISNFNSNDNVWHTDVWFDCYRI